MENGRPLALITGASSGIGATFARQLAAEGYDLILVARRVDRLEALAAELRDRHGIQSSPMSADLTLDDDLARVSETLAGAGRLALLVNNAGFGTKGLFFEADASQQDAMHRLHVLATERLTRAALPGMIARGKGSVISVSSVAAFLQGPSNVSYCATKAWMNSFTRGLALEMQFLRSPVVVQALCPGYTYSEFHDVMQVDRAEIPKSWWLEADFVVAESLRALKRGTVIVIPSLRYRILVRLIKLMPDWLFRLGAKRYRKVRRK
jgi:short-subunit dehydrogenase